MNYTVKCMHGDQVLISLKIDADGVKSPFHAVWLVASTVEIPMLDINAIVVEATYDVKNQDGSTSSVTVPVECPIPQAAGNQDGTISLDNAYRLLKASSGTQNRQSNY